MKREDLYRRFVLVERVISADEPYLQFRTEELANISFTFAYKQRAYHVTSHVEDIKEHYIPLLTDGTLYFHVDKDTGEYHHKQYGCIWSEQHKEAWDYAFDAGLIKRKYEVVSVKKMRMTLCGQDGKQLVGATRLYKHDGDKLQTLVSIHKATDDEMCQFDAKAWPS